jgi:5-methylcytosine-specific restriction endonuclease McrA
MTKREKERLDVWKLFGGRCAYCGCELKDHSGKYMHIDHVEALHRNWWTKGNDSLFPENDRKDNLFPSCPQCNNYKNSYDLETFRDLLKDTMRKLQNITLYRNAVRFGFIELKEWDGIFYFEKQDKEDKQ